MDIESSSIESSGLGGAAEAVREVSEKQKESYKKAQAQLQRAKKDEKKAKHDNDELFRILAHFIQNPYYEELVPSITELLSISTPSRYILVLISLIYPDAALYFCEAIGNRGKISLLQALHHYNEPWQFNESEIDPSLRNWITFWMHGSNSYITSHDNSVVMQQKLETLLYDKREIFENALTLIITFFFRSRNVVIPQTVARSYALFIKKNIDESLKKASGSHPDADILQGSDIQDQQLFGL